MAHKITDEFLEKLATSRVYPLDRGYIIVGDDLVEIIRELQERRKADTAEFAGWQTKRPGGDWLNIKKEELNHYRFNEELPVREVYTVPRSVSERDRVRREHAEWSLATFGSVGPVGPLKHLSKEALEAAEKPDDLSEWADMQFLLWDVQRRAGISDGQITQAMIEKLAVNKQREWPEPKDGEPRLHIKEPLAPVMPEEITEILDWLETEISAVDTWYRGSPSYEHDAGWMKDAALNVVEHARKAFSAPAVNATAGNSPVISVDPASGPDRSVEVRYFALPGYVMVPTKANIAMIRAGGKAAREYLEEHGGNSPQVIYQAMLAAAQQPALLAAEVSGE